MERKELPDSNLDEQVSEAHNCGNNNKKSSDSVYRNILLYLHDLVYLLCAILLVFLLCFRIVIVSGSSMKNTLVDGDYLLLLSNVFYSDPQPGDIIVASKDSFDNGAPIVKRVIAVEGQEVDIDFATGSVYVDGEMITENYISSPTSSGEGVQFPLTVEEGCLFVMGDNRAWSRDSRYADIGQIDCREVLGKALFLFLPGTDKGNMIRDFSRIGGLS